MMVNDFKKFIKILQLYPVNTYYLFCILTNLLNCYWVTIHF